MLRSSFKMALLALGLAAPVYAEDARDSSLDALERGLAEEASLPALERLALARQPALQEAKARTAAQRARAEGADRFPDPEFKYEQWAVPLRKPYALDRANMLMFGLRQSFPAPGARQARERAAAEELHMAELSREALARDLLLRLRRTYFDYYAADRALRVHLEHLNIAEQIVAQVRANYEIGRGAQEDVLKVLLEQARLHNDVAEVRQQRESSRLLLNALAGRAPDAALGPAADLSAPSALPEVAQLDQARKQGRPELAAAEHAIRRSVASLEGTQIAARRPSFMVGADYWLMPSEPSQPAYGAMVTMSLPWLNPGRRADVKEAEQVVAAERHAASALETSTAFELRDAHARLTAAQSSLQLVEQSLLPQAEQSMESARAAFAVGRTSLLSLLDALRAYVQIRLEHARTLSRVMAQRAAVEFAAGTSLTRLPTTEKTP